MKWSLRHKSITLVIIFAMVIASFTLMKKGFIGRKFMASGDNGKFMLTEKGLPEEISMKMGKNLESQEESFGSLAIA